MSRFSLGSFEAEAKDSTETYEMLGFMDLTPSNIGSKDRDIKGNNEASGNDTIFEHLVC
jgi:hypothetical protein